jgi:iron complex transport system ATP-binding protein
MNGAVLQTHDLAIGYEPSRRQRHVVADDIHVSLESGELICLIGPNGAGKSTLLRTIAGMQPPLAGHVTLMGQDVHRMRSHELARHLSLVLTERVNVGLLTGYEVVALGRHPYTDWMGQLLDEDHAIVQWAIEAVSAQELAARNLNEMSDGERQKIMIARALAQEPHLMILDEPTAFLDLPRRVEVMHLLRQLARTTDQAILLSTHDLDLALRTADRIWLLPQGGPLSVGAPEDLVLSGDFQCAFHSAGVHFDIETGSFKLDSEHVGIVKLEGDGVGSFWTRRALEREGFTVVSNGAVVPAHILVRTDDPLTWRLTTPHRTVEFTSIRDLIGALKAGVKSLS